MLTNHRTKKAKDTAPEIGPDEEAVPVPSHPLDTPEMKEHLLKLRAWFYQAQASQRDNRYEMDKDQRYYDGEQWSEEDKRALEARGQAPLVFNLVKNTCNWILGTERKSRVDYAILPRTKEDKEGAEVKQKLLKYLADVNKSRFHWSQSFRDAVIPGLGWIETGIRGDETEEPLYLRFESWRNMWYDHLSVEHDMSDARFVFRSKWVDLDIAQKMFPDRAAELLVEAKNTNRLYPAADADPLVADPGLDLEAYTEDPDMATSWRTRQRVRLIECWYRAPENVKVIRTKRAENGAIYREGEDKALDYLVNEQAVSVFDMVKLTVRVAVFCNGTLLLDAPSPYRHNRFPFIPIWCYRQGKDNAPYGVVRDLRDPQDDYNKRRSKALFILSTNKVIADDNAFGSEKKLQEVVDEAARPDGVILKRPGSDVKLITDNALAAQHIDMMRDDAQLIQLVSGVTDENLGRETNAKSGVAIEARQNQGLVSCGVIFDNYYAAIQAAGEIQLSLIEQFYDGEKVIRIAGDNGRLDFHEINKPQGDGSILNDITASQADFIVSQQDYRDTIRQAMFETMLEMTGKLPPEMGIALLDLVVEMSDIPNRDEFVARIRKINGQKDPNISEDDPEVLAQEEAEAAKQAEEQELLELQKALQKAELALKKAQTDKTNAEAVAKGIESLYSAMQAANVAVTTPATTPVADSIALSAGFRDHNAPPLIPQAVMAQGIAPQQVRENTSPMFPPRAAAQGLENGIETPMNDGGM